MTNIHLPIRRRPTHSRGQSLVEFSLVVVPFVFIMMGIFDLGRGIYMMNGTAEAAREIARVTSVHSGCPQDPHAVRATSAPARRPPMSSQPSAGSCLRLAINTTSDITCVDINDVVKADNTASGAPTTSGYGSPRVSSPSRRS